MIPRTYETLKQVQGDKIVITTQPRWGEGSLRLETEVRRGWKGKSE
jgi:hypothetical protein